MNPGSIAAALAQALGRIVSRRHAQRRAILESKIPQQWKDFLESRCDHYRRLSVPRRSEFHQQLQIFLAERRITGVHIQVGEDIRLLVAASAVTLSVGWPGYTWDRLAEVIVYPDNFDRDYRLGRHDLSGQAHPWGIVILSAPVLLRGFELDDGHLGYHEFAHLLDRSLTGGVPAYLADEQIRTWTSIMQTEEERLRRGDSELDPYGLSGPNELFAVAVEAFFKKPASLLTAHADLYAFLSGYFQQDPAAWSSSQTTRTSTSLNG